MLTQPVVFPIIGGLLFVASMFALFAAWSNQSDARQAWRHARRELNLAEQLAVHTRTWVAPETRELLDRYRSHHPDEPVVDGEVVEDADTLGDTVEEQEPTRPRGYLRRHGLGRTRELLQRYDAADGLDISPDDEAQPTELPAVHEPTASDPTLAAAGAAEAEGISSVQLDAELVALLDRIEPVLA